ncbi:MAG: peptide deformylase [Holosporaceae bacterium]|jgi:peptide deformylase|nr:peptide deformylase [Holosporaceae bacterium]
MVKLMSMQHVVDHPESVSLQIYPTKILRSKSAEVLPSEKQYIGATFDVMERIMEDHNGIGIAAPQIGLSKQLVLIDFEYADPNSGEKHGLKVRMVNPQITDSSREKEDSQEGCLSFPGVHAIVQRSMVVSVKYLNENLEPCFITNATGLAAFCLQHECGHLDGRMFFNALSAKDKASVLKTYRQIKDGDIIPEPGEIIVVETASIQKKHDPMAGNAAIT